MLDHDLSNALKTITDSRNPEIHHYHRGLHPGLGWYIKTIVPGPSDNKDIDALHYEWRDFQITNRNMVRLSHHAYDWSGCQIHGWWTVWLHESIDVIWRMADDGKMRFSMVSFNHGLNLSAELIKQWLRSTAPDDTRSHGNLEEIAEFLRTYTSEPVSRENRKRMRIISND